MPDLSMYSFSMNTYTLFLFSLTVLPLVCTPGPDILFIASQAMLMGRAAGLKATVGVLLGYAVYALLVAIGLATLIASSPMLFETIRWIGIVYLVYLASKLLRAALKADDLAVPTAIEKNQFYKGFLTSLLNPKGMMVYIAILPQFMDQQSGNTSLQAFVLSAVFIFWCGVIYSATSFGLGKVSKGGLSARRRRQIDGTAGMMVLIAAVVMAVAG